MTALLERTEPITPTANEMKLASESVSRLARVVNNRRQSVRVQIESDQEAIAIPMSAFQLFANILAEMAKGNAVTLIPIHAELTTQQAADLLNVSRPYLVRLIEEGTLPARMVGTHRRVRFEDLLRVRTVREITVGWNGGIWSEVAGLMVLPIGREAKEGCCDDCARG